jgi:hypothetical protein
VDRTTVLKQIDETFSRVSYLTGFSQFDDHTDMRNEAASEAVSLLTATIERFAPPGSSYLKNARLSHVTSYFQVAIAPLIGVLKALRVAYENDYLQSVQELVHADVFGDFLEMADHLLEQGYKDPAAVIAGSVLEEHLRKLAANVGIVIVQGNGSPKKANLLNDELTASDVYSKLDQKSVTAWLDLRNKAAHGRYSDYTNDQAVLMMQSVRNFISRLPA